MRYPDIKFEDVAKIWPDLNEMDKDVLQQLEIEALYSSYLAKQQADILDFKKNENIKIPSGFNYDSEMISLPNEARIKFKQNRPLTIGAAGRIPGITPAAVTALMVAIRQNKVA